MASTRAQQAQLIKNQTFLDQLAGALLAAAVQVINEGAGATNHAHRLLFANAILVNPAAQASFMAPGILTNPTISAEASTPASIPDGDVDFVVAGLFDTYANQYAAQAISGAPLHVGG
jgi:hypothetical protein